MLRGRYRYIYRVSQKMRILGRYLVRVWRMDAEGSYNLCLFIICGLMDLSLPSPAPQPQLHHLAAAPLPSVSPRLTLILNYWTAADWSMDQADSGANICGVIDIVDIVDMH